MMLSLLPLIVGLSVIVILLPGNSATVNNSDEGIERDRRQDYYGSEPSYFIRTSNIHPLRRQWMNQATTFAGKI